MNRIAILHQTSLSQATSGGIDSFIRDVLDSEDPLQRKFHLLGAVRGDLQGPPDSRQTIICRLPQKRRMLPDSIRMALAAVRRRRLIRTYSSIHVHRLEYGPLVRLIHRRAEISAFVHTPTAEALGRESDSLWRLAPGLHRLWERLSFASVDVVYTFSYSEHERLTALGQGSTFIGSSYRGDLFYPPESQAARQRSVLWIGRFEQPKDPLLAIEVMNRIAADPELRDLKSVIVGSGSLEAQMRERLKAPVQILEPLSRSEVARELQSCGVLLATSHFEAAPRLICEAIASRTPIVCTEASDPERLASPHNICSVVSDRDAQSLVEGIRRSLAISHITRSEGSPGGCLADEWDLDVLDEFNKSRDLSHFTGRFTDEGES